MDIVEKSSQPRGLKNSVAESVCGMLGPQKNNELSNLRFICPNCHTQTHNYGSKNVKNFKERIKNRIQAED